MNSTNLTTQKLDRVIVAAISGGIDGVTSTELQKKLMALLIEDKKPLILDFKAVNYISSAGMRMLLLISKCSKDLNTVVCLINVSTQVEEFLEMAGFLAFLKKFKDLETAMLRLEKSS